MLHPYLLLCNLFALLISSGVALVREPPAHIPDPIHFSLPPISTPTPTGTPPNTTPICNLFESDKSTTLNMTTAYQDSVTGKTVQVFVDQIIAKPGENGHDSGQSQMSLRVDLDSVEIFATTRTISPQGSVDADIDWHNLENGAHTANFSIDNHNVTTGTVDGKRFAAVPLQDLDSTAKLERREGPLLHITPSLQFNISPQELEQATTKGMQACKAEVASHLSPSNSSRALLLARDDRTQDPGHFSNTYFAGSCIACEVTATVTVAAAEAFCIIATCIESFGIGCAGCYAAAATAQFFGLAACNFSGACCPINCGKGSFPTNPPNCCFGGETCVDPLHGYCCSEGQQPCAGTACCNSDQSCISSGPQQGLCCPPDSVCGELCCPNASDVCVDNSHCCAAGDTCGTVCCNPIDPTSTFPVLTPRNYCADPARSLCCPTGTVDVNGICCAKDAINCDGACCTGSCSPTGQCVPSITNAECLAMGALGSCADVPGCAGATSGPNICLANGCCQNVPR